MNIIGRDVTVVCVSVGYLSSLRASPPFGQYQIGLLDKTVVYYDSTPI